MQFRVGDTINQYRILGHIGEGGMGVVYLAEDTRLRRKVALKFVSSGASDASEEEARFHREAQAAARLNHPNICTVYELGESEGATFIAMEYVEGITLKERMRQGGIEETDIRSWLKQIAEGLYTAHEAGIIHRDIKPANMMITPRGLLKIMDFGIARFTDAEVELTQANSTIGTISYMSPEQARGEKVNAQTDIWAVGVILYELTTGRRPFDGAFREAIMYAMMHTDPEPPASLNPEIKEDLNEIILRCLQKNREDRYTSLAELIGGTQQHDGYIAEAPTTVHATGREETVTLLGSKRRRVLAGGIVALLALLLFLPELRKRLTGGDHSRELPPALHLAVLPFDSFSDTPEDNAFSNGLAHLVATNLMKLEHDREELWIIPVREVLSQGVTSANQARDAFEVNLTVSGTIVNLPGSFQITLDITDAETMRVIGSDVIELAALDPLEVQTQIVEKLGTLLGIESAGSLGGSFANELTTDPEAYKLYIQAQGFIQQYDDEGNIDEAIRLYEEAIGIDSTYALAYAGAGFAYARKYFFVRDIALFDQANVYTDRALELNDALAEVWVAAGRVRLDSGKLEEGRAALERAIEIDPESYEANRRLGYAHRLAYDYEKARTFYEKAIAIQPNYWEGYTSMGNLLGTEGRYEEAIASYEKAAELVPANSFVQTTLATQYFNNGDTLKCIEALERSIELNPNALAYNNLGITLRIAHLYDRALDAFKKAVALSENSADYNLNLGTSYYILQQPDSARTYWLRAAALFEEQLENVNPNDEYLLFLTAEVFAKLGDREAAQNYLQRFLELDGQSALYWNNVYMLYEYLEDRSSALAALERALEIGFSPWHHDWSPWLADVYEDPDYIALLERYGK